MISRSTTSKIPYLPKTLCDSPLDPCSPLSSISTPSRLSNSAIESTARLSPSLISSFSSFPFCCSSINSEILGEFLKKEENIENTGDCLKGNKVSSSLRSRMVDWMAEVTFKSECAPETLFLSVNIMDRFLKESGRNGKGIKRVDLHLVGVTSMLIASKLADIVKMDTCYMNVHVVNKKYEPLEMANKELEILKTLNFRGTSCTEIEFIGILASLLEEIPERRDEIIKEAKKIAIVNLARYEFCGISQSLRAACSVYLSIQKIDHEKASESLEKIAQIVGKKYCKEEIQKTVEEIEGNIRLFKRRYPGLDTIETLLSSELGDV